jgi:hypothetical protein
MLPSRPATATAAPVGRRGEWASIPPPALPPSQVTRRVPHRCAPAPTILSPWIWPLTATELPRQRRGGQGRQGGRKESCGLLRITRRRDMGTRSECEFVDHWFPQVMLCLTALEFGLLYLSPPQFSNHDFSICILDLCSSAHISNC